MQREGVGSTTGRHCPRRCPALLLLLPPTQHRMCALLPYGDALLPAWPACGGSTLMRACGPLFPPLLCADTVKVRLQTQSMAKPIYGETRGGGGVGWGGGVGGGGVIQAAAATPPPPQTPTKHLCVLPCAPHRTSLCLPAAVVPNTQHPPPPSYRRRHRLLQEDAAVGGRAGAVQGRQLTPGRTGAGGGGGWQQQGAAGGQVGACCNSSSAAPAPLACTSPPRSALH